MTERHPKGFDPRRHRAPTAYPIWGVAPGLGAAAPADARARRQALEAVLWARARRIAGRAADGTDDRGTDPTPRS